MLRKAILGSSAFLLIASLLSAAAFATDPISVVGPDNRVQIAIQIEDGALKFTISFRDQPVIESSPIEVSLDGTVITSGVELGEAKRFDVNETYAYRGVHSKAVNHCRGATIPIKHPKTGTAYTLEVRAFIDGAAFRYVIPGEEQKSRVPDESTAFKLPAYSTVWYHDLSGHYEAVHKRQPLAEVPADQWAAPPLTFKLPGGNGYASIAEAALINYPGMALRATGSGGFQLALGDKHPISGPYRLRYANDIERVSKPATIAGAITSPWRVVMVGADLNTLVSSDIIPNLCPPPDPKLFPDGMATDWIKPGRAVWRYLDGGENNYDGAKEFCRLAGELGFEYNVIEGLWRRFTDEQLKELVDFGRQRGVAQIVWVHSNRLRDPQARQELFKRCRDFGIAGLKIDFFDHEAKEVIDLYQTILNETAEHHLVVNFHGSNKPAGEPRTWPHELVRESVRGMESRRTENRAWHDATLPFTRYLAGHGEYTPVIFGERRADTTWAHQVATAAVFTAPLLTYGCNPQTMLDHPCGPMLKSIPSVWDETIVLPPSEISECAVLARRNGNTWFLAVVNGPSARKLEVPLSFLGEGDYQALVIRDQKDEPAAVQIENTTAKRGDTLPIDMPHGGGFIARFSKN